MAALGGRNPFISYRLVTDEEVVARIRKFRETHGIGNELTPRAVRFQDREKEVNRDVQLYKQFPSGEQSPRVVVSVNLYGDRAESEEPISRTPRIGSPSSTDEEEAYPRREQRDYPPENYEARESIGSRQVTRRESAEFTPRADDYHVTGDRGGEKMIRRQNEEFTPSTGYRATENRSGRQLTREESREFSPGADSYRATEIRGGRQLTTGRSGGFNPRDDGYEAAEDRYDRHSNRREFREFAPRAGGYEAMEDRGGGQPIRRQHEESAPRVSGYGIPESRGDQKPLERQNEEFYPRPSGYGCREGMNHRQTIRREPELFDARAGGYRVDEGIGARQVVRRVPRQAVPGYVDDEDVDRGQTIRREYERDMVGNRQGEGDRELIRRAPRNDMGPYRGDMNERREVERFDRPTITPPVVRECTRRHVDDGDMRREHVGKYRDVTNDKQLIVRDHSDNRILLRQRGRQNETSVRSSKREGKRSRTGSRAERRKSDDIKLRLVIRRIVEVKPEQSIEVCILM